MFGEGMACKGFTSLPRCLLFPSLCLHYRFSLLSDRVSWNFYSNV